VETHADILQARRTYYAMSNKFPISNERPRKR